MSRSSATYYYPALTFLSGFLVSLWTNVISDGVGKIVAKVPVGHWTIPIAASIVMVGALFFRRRARDFFFERTLARGLLEGVARALTVSRAPKGLKVRGHLHRYDKKSHSLQPFEMWSEPREGDAALSFDVAECELSEVIIVKAWKEKRPVVAEPDHHRKNAYPPAISGRIWSELRSVLAVPVMAPNAALVDAPIGVISFDSNETLQNLHLDGEDARLLVQRVAESCAKLID